MEALKNMCLKCQNCNLYKTATNKVFGERNPHAEIMFVGEAPGAQEDKTGRPFVGAAGKLLDALLAQINLTRDDVYITNIVKCRPPNNRNPLPEEINACIGYLKKQIELINPEIIVTLGNVPARVLIKPNFFITKERGKIFGVDGRIIYPTFHPAAILRNPRRRILIEEDFKQIRKI